MYEPVTQAEQDSLADAVRQRLPGFTVVNARACDMDFRLAVGLSGSDGRGPWEWAGKAVKPLSGYDEAVLATGLVSEFKRWFASRDRRRIDLSNAD